MPKELIMYPWNVIVRGYYEYGYRCGEKMIEDDVDVIARNRKEAKKLAIEAIKEKDASFIFCKIKIRNRDIRRIKK